MMIIKLNIKKRDELYNLHVTKTSHDRIEQFNK